MQPPFESCELYGELSLGGEIRPVRGALLAATAAARAGHRMIVPPTNVAETLLVSGCEAAVAKHLLDVVAHASGASALSFAHGAAPKVVAAQHLDLNEVRGQLQAKRALEIAAAGDHSLVFDRAAGHRQEHARAAPAGTVAADERSATRSKSLQFAASPASRSSLRSGACGRFAARITRRRQSRWSAVGTARVPARSRSRITACCFSTSCRSSIAACWKCCASRSRAAASRSRARRGRRSFRRRFQLVAAMNPCPCGYLGDEHGRCRCTAEQVQRYRSRLSGPLIDRLDLHVEVPRVPAQVLAVATGATEASAVVAKRVLRAREQQIARQGTLNARLDNKAVERFCATTRDAITLLNRAAETLGLSARAVHRILKVARTIADLAQAEAIDVRQIGEALALRVLDKDGGGSSEYPREAGPDGFRDAMRATS